MFYFDDFFLNNILLAELSDICFQMIFTFNSQKIYVRSIRLKCMFRGLVSVCYVHFVYSLSRTVIYLLLTTIARIVPKIRSSKSGKTPKYVSCNRDH